MSDKNDTIFQKGQNAIRMAYTLDNDQPVRCTLISEEPLFYLDAEILESEDDLSDLDFLDLELMRDFQLQQGSITKEEDGIMTTENFPDEISPEAISLFKEQFAPKKASKKESNLKACLDMIRQSRMGTALLDFVADQKITITESSQIAGIFYDRMAGQITVRALLPFFEKIFLIVREARRAFQHKQGALIHPLLFHPDHAILVNRIQAADLMVHMVRVAWEVRLAGNNALWDHLDTKGYQDLTRAFSREALADFRSLNNGQAMAATFEAWFMSERCRAFDRSLIQQMLADYQSYIQTAGHMETSRILSHQMISALGTMTYGNNYLSAHAAIILGDPIFTEIRDRSNANFLWFIKFEQSFRQTERDLQFKDGSSVSSQTTNGTRHGQTTATILHLPLTRETGTTPSKTAQAGGAGGVVDLQGWRNRSDTP